MATRELKERELRMLLSYDPLTGLFNWLPRKGRGARNDLTGKIAGSPHIDGYVVIQARHQKYLAHRLAWLFIHGNFPENEIDHINGVRTDNRASNLRDVSKSVNIQNQRPVGKSLGIDYHKASKRWRARITLNKDCRLIGHFEHEQDAQAAYLVVKRRLHEGCTI